MTIDELSDIYGDFLCSIRLGRGFSQEKYDRLAAAIPEYLAGLADSTSVPKQAASLFTEIPLCIADSAPLYRGEESARISAAGAELMHVIVDEL